MSLIPDPRKEFHAPMAANSVHDFTVKGIDGADIPLAHYRGYPLLIVNTATLCPSAAQFISLEALHQKFKDRGLAVLAFPSNSFGMEPRPDVDIRHICESRYKVTFPVFSKIAVNGKDQAPLYRFLTNREKNPQFGGAIDNDFTKFLIGHDGHVVGRFRALLDPLSPEIVQAIERTLRTPVAL
jgi:Glutathione peroxidase